MKDVTIVELPKLYENMDEATIGGWQVAEGDRVAAGDFIVELITDKTVVEFEAPVSGRVLRIYGTEKSTVPQGYALCCIGEEGQVAPDLEASNERRVAEHVREQTGGLDVSLLGLQAQPQKPLQKPAFRAAPAAKIYARQQGVELSEVAEFCGRETIHRKDVEDYVASRPAHAPLKAAEPDSAAEVTPSRSGDPVSQRVALVTGGTGGLGAAIVRRLAAEGVAVAIHYCRDQAGAEALSRELAGQGVRHGLFQMDLAEEPQGCQKLVDAVQATFGRLDILVNNAGCLADGPLAFQTDAQWSKVLELCLNVPFKLIRACAMGMAHRRWGRIVNMSSDAGRMGSANRGNYAAAKEGLCGLTRSAALELAGMGVRVNAVSPGFIDTPMTANLTDRRRQELSKTIPVRRFGRPEEVAELVCFLCSERSDYITGQVISVNGGLCM